MNFRTTTSMPDSAIGVSVWSEPGRPQRKCCHVAAAAGDSADDHDGHHRVVHGRHADRLAGFSRNSFKRRMVRIERNRYAVAVRR